MLGNTTPMNPIEARAINPLGLSRLAEVSETRHPLGDLHPIWVRHGTCVSGPCISHPERHPYCEIGMVCKGEGKYYVENEEARYRAGDLLLIGTGLPHWGDIAQFPYEFITVYFLPNVLVDLDPKSDGLQILRRFTAKQSLSDRMVRPPAELRRRLVPLFKEILADIGAPVANQDFHVFLPPVKRKRIKRMRLYTIVAL